MFTQEGHHQVVALHCAVWRKIFTAHPYTLSSKKARGGSVSRPKQEVDEYCRADTKG